MTRLPTQTPTKHYKARLLTAAEIEPRLVAAWAELEERALYANAFLSPHFVLPALKYLEAAQKCFGIFVEKESAGTRDLVGVAWLQARKPTRRFPLPHLAAFLSIHSYLSDFLLERECAADALQAIYRALRPARQGWHALYINNASAESVDDEIPQAAARENGMRWHLVEQWQRVIFRPAQAQRALSEHISKRRLKNYQKSWKKLEEQGRLEWVLRQDETNNLQTSIEAFLRVEHSGWKKEEGTSLLSHPCEADFFRDMMTGFWKAGRAYFTEITLNGQVIASTANLVSGQIGFGFKTAREEQYADYGLGIANEIKLIEHAGLLSHLSFLDSCAAPDSYLNELWPERRGMREGWFSLTPIGEAALQATHLARTLKARLRRVSQSKDIPQA